MGSYFEFNDNSPVRDFLRDDPVWANMGLSLCGQGWEVDGMLVPAAVPVGISPLNRPQQSVLRSGRRRR